MHFSDAVGSSLSLRITGYQFPDAEDPQLRYSWHMIAGDAACPEGAWTFAWQALTCDESPQVSRWLREVADWCDTGLGDKPTPLTFTEPNLAFRLAGDRADEPVLEVDLDSEFRPPWRIQRQREAGDPVTVMIATSSSSLRAAAEAWDEGCAAFPDRLA